MVRATPTRLTVQQMAKLQKMVDARGLFHSDLPEHSKVRVAGRLALPGGGRGAQSAMDVYPDSPPLRLDPSSHSSLSKEEAGPASSTKAPTEESPEPTPT